MKDALQSRFDEFEAVGKPLPFSRELATDMLAFHGPGILDELVKIFDRYSGDVPAPVAEGQVSIISVRAHGHGPPTFLLRFKKDVGTCACGRPLDEVQDLGSKGPKYKTCAFHHLA